jgi:hypothetical protein
MPDHGDQIAVATRLDPDDAKSVLGVLVSDALDQLADTLADAALRVTGRFDTALDWGRLPNRILALLLIGMLRQLGERFVIFSGLRRCLRGEPPSSTASLLDKFGDVPEDFSGL